VIVRYERGLALVQPWEEFVQEDTPAREARAEERVEIRNPSPRESAEKEHPS
jgi:hypothetical protein